MAGTMPKTHKWIKSKQSVVMSLCEGKGWFLLLQSIQLDKISLQEQGIFFISIPLFNSINSF